MSATVALVTFYKHQFKMAGHESPVAGVVPSCRFIPYIQGQMQEQVQEQV